MSLKQFITRTCFIVLVVGCQNNSKNNPASTASSKDSISNAVLIDTTTIYGYSINDYIIDSCTVKANQGLTPPVAKIWNISTNYF